MPIEPVRMMLFPRHTSLVGVATYYQEPVNARQFYAATLTAWRGGGIGVDSGTLLVETSQDLRYWDSAGTSLSTGETPVPVGLEVEWLRVGVGLTGTSPSVPVWVLAEFLLRGDQRSDGGG